MLALSLVGSALAYFGAVRSAFGRVVAPDESHAKANPKPSKRGFHPDVEGLRAVAVGAVLLYHAGMPFARGGYDGVDVFFVISGSMPPASM